MDDRPDEGRGHTRIVRTAGWIAVAIAPAALLLAYVASPVPLSVAGSLLVTGGLTMWRPLYGLLIVAAFAPIASTLEALADTPYDSAALIEAHVLVVLLGAAVRAGVRAERFRPSAFDLAALSLAAVTIASVVAQLPVLSLVAVQGEWTSLGTWLGTEYFYRNPDLAAVHQAIWLVEGMFLAVLIGHVASTERDRAHLANMVIVGGVAAATFNALRLVEVALRRPPFVEGLIETLRTVRFNTQFGDLNAAGSYFALVTVLLAGQAGRRSRPARVSAAMLPLLALALWVSGSRVAMIASLLGTGLVVVRRWRPWYWTRAQIPVRLTWGAALLVAGGLLVFTLFPATRHGSFDFSVSTRVLLLQTGVRMAADRPVFGVGISQFYARFPEYAPPELPAAFASAVGHPVPRENAHNQFVQILAELGLLGLGWFLILLAVVLWRSVPPDQYLWRAGLLVFLATSLAGHPLLTYQVALAFWMACGALASGVGVTPRRARALLFAAGATILILVCTTPYRWQVERQDADLAGVSVGMSRWARDEEGRRYQTLDGRGAVFVSARAVALRIPLRSPDARDRQVRILMDGRPAATVMVPSGSWTEVHVPIPEARRLGRYTRIDFEVVPADGGAEGSALQVGRVVEVERKGPS